ncbi:MAG: hypothetical protein IJ529_01200 [Alphaproteobacteria bacterium]|nr:hypothetical protein [Alphaproteobacteria bacterium]MBQ9234910.1 hypothetical protein [Alphaproteobacteria bacterium]
MLRLWTIALVLLLAGTAQAQVSTTATPEDIKQEAADIVKAEEQAALDGEELMSKKARRRAKYLEQVKAERAQETNRFKLKAIANAEAREKKYEEKLKRMEEKESRFQKAARLEMEEKDQEELEKLQEPSQSRFKELAKQRAQERALKQELKEQRLHRNRKTEQ